MYTFEGFYYDPLFQGEICYAELALPDFSFLKS